MNDMNTETYDIHCTATGELARTITADRDTVEHLSSDSAEGHFRANLLDGLGDLGDRSVYAILR